MLIKNFQNFRLSYREGTRDEDVMAAYMGANIMRKKIPEYVPKPTDIVLDIGSHIGAYVIPAALQLKHGRIYALEPCRDTFSYLEKNAALNHLSNISLHPLALGGFQGTTKLFFDMENGNWGHTISRPVSNRFEEVPVDTLQNFMRNHSINRCDFLKMNCEGAEFEILLNTPPEVLKKIRLLLVEYHLDKTQPRSEKDLANHLTKAGFYTFFRDQHPHRGLLIAGRGLGFRMKALWNITKSKIRDRIRHHLKLPACF